MLLWLLFPMIFFCMVLMLYLLWRLWRWARLPARFDQFSCYLWQNLPASLRVRLHRLFDCEQKRNDIHRLIIGWTLLIIMVAILSVIYRAPLLLILVVLLPLLQISKNQNRFKLQQRAIVKELPDFCDMLAMMIAAGIPLIPAMVRVSSACEGGRLAAEISRVNQQLRQGTPFAEALQRLARRYRLPLLNEWTGLLIHGHQQGSSLVTTLRFHSLQMRQQLLNEAEKRAQEAPVKLLFPLMTCFFPVNFLVILGPIVLQLSEGGL